MNVFVLCTGRCGSVTFTKAVKHITNFTAAHESRASMVGEERLAYPPRHIEVDNRLSWLLGRMDQTYGDSARYVHLTRDPEATAASFTKRERFGIFKAYRTGIIKKKGWRKKPATTLDVSRDLVDTVTQNIEIFLRDKPHVMRFRLEDAASDFPKFWDWIGATGDLAAAQTEFLRNYNASKSNP